jgi:hypothetical protein
MAFHGGLSEPAAKRSCRVSARPAAANNLEGPSRSHSIYSGSAAAAAAEAAAAAAAHAAQQNIPTMGAAAAAAAAWSLEPLSYMQMYMDWQQDGALDLTELF